MYLDSHANSHGRINHAEENPIETWSSKDSCAWLQPIFQFWAWFLRNPFYHNAKQSRANITQALNLLKILFLMEIQLLSLTKKMTKSYTSVYLNIRL